MTILLFLLLLASIFFIPAIFLIIIKIIVTVMTAFGNFCAWFSSGLLYLMFPKLNKSKN